MKILSDFITVLDHDHANIIIDDSLYNIKAIHAATYAFCKRYHVLLTRENERSIRVIFELKENESPREITADIKSFLNAIIDHQVRFQLDQANGKIRDLIVSHAFSPLDLLKETKCL